METNRIIVKATLSNYFKYLAAGYKLNWSGEGLYCFSKPKNKKRMNEPTFIDWNPDDSFYIEHLCSNIAAEDAWNLGHSDDFVLTDTAKERLKWLVDSNRLNPNNQTSPK